MVPALWLTDIQPAGRVAFRRLTAVTLSANNQDLATVAASFEDKDYTTGNMTRLRAELRAALVSEGLFADEADALLNTWELSYFKSPGLRLFFIVPREWTDHYLPLEISPAADIKRVMVGRIELVSPGQRKLLHDLAARPIERTKAEAMQIRAACYRSTVPFRPNDTLAGLHVAIPPGYQTYLDLGRFRNALILDEQTHRPAPGLEAFISSYGLQGYHPSESAAGD